MKLDLIRNKKGNVMKQAGLLFGGFVVLGFMIVALVYGQNKFTDTFGDDPTNATGAGYITSIEGNVSRSFLGYTNDNVTLVSVLLVIGVISLVVVVAYGMTRLFGE